MSGSGSEVHGMAVVGARWDVEYLAEVQSPGDTVVVNGGWEGKILLEASKLLLVENEWLCFCLILKMLFALLTT